MPGVSIRDRYHAGRMQYATDTGRMRYVTDTGRMQYAPTPNVYAGRIRYGIDAQRLCRAFRYGIDAGRMQYAPTPLIRLLIG